MTEQYSDAAKRIHDTYTLHRMADPLGAIGGWFAVSLADGKSDNVLYRSRRDCMRHQKGNEKHYGYIQIVPANMELRACEAWLSGQRKLDAAGIRVIDPELPGGGPELIPRATAEDQASQMRAIFGTNRGRGPRNLLLPGRDF